MTYKLKTSSVTGVIYRSVSTPLRWNEMNCLDGFTFGAMPITNEIAMTDRLHSTVFDLHANSATVALTASVMW